MLRYDIFFGSDNIATDLNFRSRQNDNFWFTLTYIHICDVIFVLLSTRCSYWHDGLFTVIWLNAAIIPIDMDTCHKTNIFTTVAPFTNMV